MSIEVRDDSITRLMMRVIIDSGPLPSACWIFQGTSTAGKDKKYRLIRVGGRQVLAHRLSFAAFRGDIPHGLHLDHLCRNTTCVNPSHLDPVTAAENNKRGFAPTMVKHRDALARKVAGEFVEDTHAAGVGRQE